MKLANLFKALCTVIIVLAAQFGAFAQVTTSAMTGIITDTKGEALIGANVVAVHVPSGTNYGTATDLDGSYRMPGMRVGGPYKITVTYTGFADQVKEGIYISLGTAATINFELAEQAVVLDDIVISSSRNATFSSDRTGAAVQFDANSINSLPTIGRTINDITKYNAYSNGRSFAGQDARFNNFTIDGAAFNNGFGLGDQAQAGGRTGSTAISLDALEEVQINIAPFDVRQSGFAGAGINAVTRSGTNEISGSVFHFFKNENFLGDKPNDTKITIKSFDEKTTGFRLGGPIVKNKIFFFVNGETVKRSVPALDYIASRPGATGLVSRTTAEDLEQLSAFLQDKFDYTTGAYENFNNEVTSTKFLARLDFNLSKKHKLALRYAHHDSESQQLISNSNSAGNGNRTNLATALSFENSGYIILDNTRSIVAELNSLLSNKTSNNLIVTFNRQIEDRKYRSQIFPTIDVLSGTTTYTGFGFDPFTPGNQLNYNTFNVTDNFTYYSGKHTLTAGLNFEYYTSNNLFFPASNGAWVFNSLTDFYTAANDYLANPGLTTSNVPINRFQYRYSLLEGGADPLQVLKVYRSALYVQDEIKFNKQFQLTLGLRADNFVFGKTALENPIVSGLTFRDVDGSNLQTNTANLPKPRVLLSPRVGFNLDVTGEQTTQLRGGTGIFTSNLPYVWISNQVGNNGVLTGFINVTGNAALAYPFTSDPTVYRPGANPDLTKLTFDLATTDEDFKFPQVWKSNFALDQKLFAGIIGTVELIYNKNLQAVRYHQANFKDQTARFTGDDTRIRYASDRTINKNITNNIYLTNTDEGSSYSATFKLERQVSKGLGGMLAYTYGQARDLMSAGSIAFGSWANVFTVNGTNYAELAYSNNDLRHRVVGYLNYRLNFGNKTGAGALFTLGMVSNSGGKISYTYGGDMNGDGTRNNDLLYVPTSGSKLTWDPLVVGSGANAVTYSAEQQAAAWDTYVAGNDYLSERKGQYAERNGGEFPWLTRFDLTVEPEFFFPVGGKKNGIRLRMDIFNVANMLNNKWGVGNRITNFNPISYSRTTTEGVPVYKIATQQVGSQTILIKDTFQKSTTTDDVWQMQLGVRYIFN